MLSLLSIELDIVYFRVSLFIWLNKHNKKDSTHAINTDFPYNSTTDFKENINVNIKDHKELNQHIKLNAVTSAEIFQPPRNGL